MRFCWTCTAKNTYKSSPSTASHNMSYLTNKGKNCVTCLNSLVVRCKKCSKIGNLLGFPRNKYLRRNHLKDKNLLQSCPIKFFCIQIFKQKFIHISQDTVIESLNFKFTIWIPKSTKSTKILYISTDRKI